jgi:NADH dehydrogenase
MRNENEIVTVFGASGLIGRHTVQALARAGYRIRACVRYPNLAHYLPPMGTVGQIQLMKCNVLDEDSVARAVQGSSAAINLVGILYPAGGQNYEDIHIEAPQTIAKAAKAAGVETLLHVTTMGISEESESNYSRSKAEGENAIREIFPNATLIKPSIVFGPEDNFFNKFAWLARVAPVLPLVGGGHTKFQPVFVADVADAITKCVGEASTRGKTYELGGPAIYSFKEMIQAILHATGRKNPLLPMPFWMAAISAVFLQFLPGKLLTPDQVKFLKTDNVPSPGALGLKDLGIQPESLEAILPTYLWRFRPKGQYENSSSERAIGVPEIR